MAFITYSILEHGVPRNDTTFSSDDTYVTVISTFPNAVGGSVQMAGLTAIKKLFNVIYEGPVAFNHHHHERKVPCQKIIVFEKKCPLKQSPVHGVLLTEKTPEETI